MQFKIENIKVNGINIKVPLIKRKNFHGLVEVQEVVTNKRTNFWFHYTSPISIITFKKNINYQKYRIISWKISKPRLKSKFISQSNMISTSILLSFRLQSILLRTVYARICGFQKLIPDFFLESDDRNRASLLNGVQIKTFCSKIFEPN